MSPEFEAIVEDSSLSHEEKKGRIAAMQIDVDRELRTSESELASMYEKREQLTWQIDGIKSVKDWLERGQWKLERNDCSRFHKLREAVAFNRIIYQGDNKLTKIFLTDTAKTNIIVVEHDWAAAFGEEVKTGGNDFSLPYPATVFEMRISGRTVLLLAFQPEGGTPMAVPFIECDNGVWYAPFEQAQDMTALHMPWWQVKAICVALDAEVATKDAVRAPHALNQKRIKNGKLPLSDFHVVRLNRNPRTVHVSGGAGDYTKKRLHFRRGHWRHYEGFKTWVRWALVGNPDLGFIDKEYRI